MQMIKNIFVGILTRAFSRMEYLYFGFVYYETQIFINACNTADFFSFWSGLITVINGLEKKRHKKEKALREKSIFSHLQY